MVENIVVGAVVIYVMAYYTVLPFKLFSNFVDRRDERKTKPEGRMFKSQPYGPQWPDSPPGPDIGVREPRRPQPSNDQGAISL